MDSLRPCPFCGGEAHITVSSDGYGVECSNEMCIRTIMQEHPSEEYAALVWNARAERTCEEYGSVRVWQSCNVWSHELSCGHEVDTLEKEPPNYCPNCGARVTKSDQDL